MSVGTGTAGKIHARRITPGAKRCRSRRRREHSLASRAQKTAIASSETDEAA